jgi:hypothetical protein
MRLSLPLLGLGETHVSLIFALSSFALSLLMGRSFVVAFELKGCVCDRHALALAHASGGSKHKGRGITHLEGDAKRRAAQAQRGRLGIPLVGARGRVP